MSTSSSSKLPATSTETSESSTTSYSVVPTSGLKLEIIMNTTVVRPGEGLRLQIELANTLD